MCRGGGVLRAILMQLKQPLLRQLTDEGFQVVAKLRRRDVELGEQGFVSGRDRAGLLEQGPDARAGVVESVRGVGGGYRFAGNLRRLTLMDIIRLFEPGLGTGAEPVPGGSTPVDLALDAVLSEIDQFARATFSSITLATMLRLMQRQRKAQAPAPEA